MDNDNALNALKSIEHNTSPEPSPENNKETEKAEEIDVKFDDLSAEETSENSNDENEETPVEIAEETPEKIESPKEFNLPEKLLSTEPKPKEKHGFRTFLSILFLILFLALGFLYAIDKQYIDCPEFLRNLLIPASKEVEPVAPAVPDDRTEETELTDETIRTSLEKQILAIFGDSAALKEGTKDVITYKKADSEETYLAYIVKYTVQTTKDFDFAFVYVAEPETVLAEDFTFTADNLESFPYYRYQFVGESGAGNYTFEEKLKIPRVGVELPDLPESSTSSSIPSPES